MSKRTTQKLAELKKLASEAGSNIYQRVKLADEILSDLSWLTQTYNGDELKAQDALQDEFFADVKGYISLGKLRLLYKEFPEESAWKELRYDLNAMENQYDENHAKDDVGLKGTRTSWKTQAEKYKAQLDEAKAALAKTSRENDQLRKEIDSLKQQVRELEQQNAELRGRIIELERFFNDRGAA